MKKTLAITLAALMTAGMTLQVAAADIDTGLFQPEQHANTAPAAGTGEETAKTFDTRESKIYWYTDTAESGTLGATTEITRTVKTRSGTTTVSATYYPVMSYEAIELINAERVRLGKGTLEFDPALAEAALQRVMETTIDWSHVRPDGTAWSTVSAVANGENIAKGSAYKTAEAVTGAWMDSEGHRLNIVKNEFTRTGIAAVKIGDTVYWVQMFGN